MTHILVSCAATKRRDACEAEKLYTSPLFEKASIFAAQKARALNGRWWILSARYGLLDPKAVIESYDETLNRMSIDERKRWATSVFKMMHEHDCVKPENSIIMLAGQRYREFLAPMLRQAGIEVSVPLAGLSIGRQLQWLSAQNQRPSALKKMNSSAPASSSPHRN